MSTLTAQKLRGLVLDQKYGKRCRRARQLVRNNLISGLKEAIKVYINNSTLDNEYTRTVFIRKDGVTELQYIITESGGEKEYVSIIKDQYGTIKVVVHDYDYDIDEVRNLDFDIQENLDECLDFLLIEGDDIDWEFNLKGISLDSLAHLIVPESMIQEARDKGEARTYTEVNTEFSIYDGWSENTCVFSKNGKIVEIVRSNFDYDYEESYDVFRIYEDDYCDTWMEIAEIIEDCEEE